MQPRDPCRPWRDYEPNGNSPSGEAAQMPGPTTSKQGLGTEVPAALLRVRTWPHFHFSLSCIGEGNGNPLQCSCLENPRDPVTGPQPLSSLRRAGNWASRPFSCLQSFPASGSFPTSQFFASGGQIIGASSSVLPVNIYKQSGNIMTSWFAASKLSI